MSEQQKDNSVNKSKKNKKFIIILSVLILICAILIILEFTTHFLSNAKHKILQAVGIENKVGNTIGNISNYGYVAEDGKYIYFMRMTDNGRYLAIYRLEKNDLNGEQEKLFETEADIAGINVINDYIFFITLKETENEDEGADNQIHRMNKDGSDHKVINDNDFNDVCFQIYAVNDRVYYIGTDECICYMDFNGENRTKLNDNKSGYIGITDKYIFYNLYKDETNEEISTYMMDLDGQNAKEINGKKMNYINVIDDYIYYLTDEGNVYRIKIDGTDDKMISDKTIFLCNINKEGIFYLDYYYLDTVDEPSGVSICKMNLDGSDEQELKRLNNYSIILGLIENGIFYMDSYSDELMTQIITFDGKQNNLLFKINYKDYYYADQTVGSLEGEEENTDDILTENPEDADTEIVE